MKSILEEDGTNDEYSSDNDTSSNKDEDDYCEDYCEEYCDEEYEPEDPEDEDLSDGQLCTDDEDEEDNENDIYNAIMMLGHDDPFHDLNVFDTYYPSNPPPPTPTEPPPPIRLGNPSSLQEKHRFVWRLARQGRYDLIDTQTSKLVLLSFYLQIKGNNFGVTQGVTQQQIPQLKGEKIYFYGHKPPLHGLDDYWTTVRAQLRELLDDFRVQHPTAAELVGEEDTSLLTSFRGQGGVKIQQPLFESDEWMFGLSDDSYYAYRKETIEDECKYITVHPDTPYGKTTRYGINPLAAHDEGDLITPEDYQRRLSQALVNVEVSVHYIPRRSLADAIFVSRPHLMHVVSREEILRHVAQFAASQTTPRRAAGAASTSQCHVNVNEMTYRQYTPPRTIRHETPSSSNGKGKRRAVDPDEEFDSRVSIFGGRRDFDYDDMLPRAYVESEEDESQGATTDA